MLSICISAPSTASMALEEPSTEVMSSVLMDCRVLTLAALAVALLKIEPAALAILLVTLKLAELAKET